MSFNSLIQQYLEEKSEPTKEDYEAMPWSLEIVKDSKKGKLYNELGELIIQLFEIRSKL
jgi:hypothetical protein